MQKIFLYCKKIYVPRFVFLFFPWEAVCGRATTKKLTLITTNWNVTSLTPSCHLCPIWIPHHGFLPVFTVIFDKIRLNDASLANDTWKNHLSVHYCFFRFLSDWPTASAPVSVLFFPFIIKLGITSLPGLFSAQQLHADVETLSFMVFGGINEWTATWKGVFHQEMITRRPRPLFSFLLQLRCWFVTGTNVFSLKVLAVHCLIPSGWVNIIFSDQNVEKCRLVSADIYVHKKNTTVFFSLPIYGLILIRGKGWLVSLRRSRNSLAAGEEKWSLHNSLLSLCICNTRVGRLGRLAWQTARCYSLAVSFTVNPDTLIELMMPCRT